MVRSIHLPDRALQARTAFRKLALSPLGRSAAVIIGRVDLDGSFVLSVTASTVRPYVLRFPTLPTDAALGRELAMQIPDSAWYDDPHGAPDWRRARTLAMAEELRLELTAEEAR